MEIIKARARYTGDNSSSKYYENNSFHYIKIKQEGSSIKIIAEEDTSENKISKTQYSSLADFFDVWNIYSVISIIRK